MFLGFEVPSFVIYGFIALGLYTYYDYRCRNYWKWRGIKQRPQMPLIGGVYAFYLMIKKGLVRVAIDDVNTYGKVRVS